MRVDAGEIEVSGDQEDDGAHRFERAISPGSALGGLKQSIDGFEEPVGLTRLRPGDDAVEVIEDHLRHLFHRLDFGALDVGAPEASPCARLPRFEFFAGFPRQCGARSRKKILPPTLPDPALRKQCLQ